MVVPIRFPRSRVRAIALLASMSLGGSLLLVAAPAAADTAPTAGVPETASTDILPTPQIDAPERKGIVWSQVVVGNTVYAGGSFTNARPAGSAVGVNTVPRSNLLSFDIRTGALSSFAPTFNGQIRGLAASPDGRRLYVVGEFTTVNGQSRSRIAAFDTATGALVAGFAPAANSRVNAVTATSTAVYIGGWQTAITASGKTVARARAAALDPATGAVLPFNPAIENGTVSAIVASPDASKVVVGGSFTSVGGSNKPGYGMAALASSTGANLPWAVNSTVRDAGTKSAITSLTTDGDSLYGTGYIYGGGGNLEGAFRANWSDGALNWVEDCHGDSYSIAPAGDVVYVASHAHYCGNLGGFPEEDLPNSDKPVMQRAMAFSKAPGYKITADPLGYANWAGKTGPAILNWWPDINTGVASGQGQGAWSVVASGDYVVLGGEFSAVNNKAQQGLVRFAKKSVAPDQDGPRLSGANYVPAARSIAAGAVNVTWKANYDRDNEFLTYDLLRDGATTPIYSETTGSRIWYDRPVLSFLDKGLAPGSAHRYQVRVTDPFGRSVLSSTVNVTVASSGTLGGYQAAVLADSPSSFWRLGETTGTLVDDTATTFDQVTTGTVRRGAPGVIAGNAATAFTAPSFASTQTATWGRNELSVEAWFSTTSTAGGQIVGFGNAKTGDSTNYDRDLYLDAAGKISFGTHSSGDRRVASATGVRYNDGRWHHVVGTVSSAGMTLYVDGKRVSGRTDVVSARHIFGFWRIGGDKSRLGNGYFTGSVDEVAIYDDALTAEQVAAHFVPRS